MHGTPVVRKSLAMSRSTTGFHAFGWPGGHEDSFGEVRTCPGGHDTHSSTRCSPTRGVSCTPESCRHSRSTRPHLTRPSRSHGSSGASGASAEWLCEHRRRASLGSLVLFRSRTTSIHDSTHSSSVVTRRGFARRSPRVRRALCYGRPPCQRSSPRQPRTRRSLPPLSWERPVFVLRPRRNFRGADAAGSARGLRRNDHTRLSRSPRDIEEVPKTGRGSGSGGEPFDVPCFVRRVNIPYSQV